MLRFGEGTRPSKYSGYVYDAVWLYALALDRLIKEDAALVQVLCNVFSWKPVSFLSDSTVVLLNSRILKSVDSANVATNNSLCG